LGWLEQGNYELNQVSFSLKAHCFVVAIIATLILSGRKSTQRLRRW